MKRTPSPFRIIGTDYLASLGAISPVVAWTMALIGRFFDPEAAAFFLRFAPAVTAAGLVVVSWRLWLIRSVIGGGTYARVQWSRGIHLAMYPTGRALVPRLLALAPLLAGARLIMATPQNLETSEERIVP